MSAVTVLKDYTFTFERGTTWGTPIQTTPNGIPTEDMPISIESVKHEIMRSYGNRGTHEDNFWMESANSIPTAQFSGPVTPDILKNLLPCVLQKSTDWSPTGSVYTMYTNQYANLPNPANSEGYYVTLVRNSPVAADDVVLSSAVCNSVTLKCDVSNDNAIMVGDWSFVGKGYSKNQTSSGTITNLALTNMYKFSAIGSATLNSNDIKAHLRSFEVTISNGAKFVNDLVSGSVVFPKWEITGKITLGANAYTEAFKDLVLNSAVSNAILLKICFGDGTVSSAGEANIESYCYLTNWSSDYNEGEVITFDFTGVFDGSSNYPIKLTFHAA